MPKLNDTQALLLGHAARHATASFLPLPATHPYDDHRVSKALKQLMASGLAAERETEAIGEDYRQDGDLRYGLFATAASLSAIGIEPEGEGAKPTTSAQTPAPEKPPRTTKSATVLAMLRRAEGATVDELIGATGWLPHTTRAALTGLRKKGHAIAKDKRDGKACYKVPAA